MNRRLVIGIGPAELTAGLALAGLSAVEAPVNDAGIARLTMLLDRDDVGVILADERLVRGLSPGARHAAERRRLPVLVSVPAPRARKLESGASQLLELLQRAVGYRVRLQ